MNAAARMSMTMGAMLAAVGGVGALSPAARAANAGVFAGVQDEARSAAAGALTIREQAAGFLVVLDHDDSPWTLGRTVEAAARYRSSLSGAGPLFIRHDHTFPLEAEARPKFSVGFFVSERMEVAPPFQIEAQPACEIASQMTDGPAWKTGVFVTRMTTELNARGLEPAGPFIEFMEVSAGAASGAAQRSRLEVAVRARGWREKEAAPVEPPIAGSEHSAESVNRSDRADALHEAEPQGEAKAPSEGKPSEETDLSSGASAFEQRGVADPGASRAARDQVMSFMNSLATRQDTVQWPLILWEHLDAGSESVAAMSEPDAAASELGAVPSESGMIATADSSPAGRLFLARRYDELAELLFPKRRKVSRDQREWLARVLAGMDELEIAMREVDGAFADEMRQLNEALGRRVESVRIDLPEPKDQGLRGQRRSVAGTDAQSIVLAALHGWSSDAAGGGGDLTSRREHMAGILGRIEGVLGEP